MQAVWGLGNRMNPIKKSKIRFQKSDFRQQLKHARDYKRQRGFNQIRHFFYNLGHAVWLLWAALFVLAAIYFVYIPNFLDFRVIDINGADSPTRAQVLTTTQNYLVQKLLLAQRNYFFLSQKKLADFILKQDTTIWKVPKITTSFPHTLVITVVPRTIQFEVKSLTQDVLVSSDGLVRQDITAQSSTTIAALTISLSSTSTISTDQKIFSDTFLSQINTAQSLTHSQLGLTVTDITLDSLDSQSFIEHTDSGITIKLSIHDSMDKIFNQIQLILANLQDSQKKNLYYIDMRYADRGFVCFKDTACAH